MPRPDFPAGTGPQNLHRPLVITVQAPSDASSTAPVKAGQPLKWGRVKDTDATAASTTGLMRQAVKCAANAIPELVAEMRTEDPFTPMSVSVLPMEHGWQTAQGRFVMKLPYTGTPDTGTDLGVCADGSYGWLVVAHKRATLTNGTLDTQKLVYTSKLPGRFGNLISVTIATPGSRSGPTVSGWDISYTPATGETATQTAGYLNANADVAAIISVAPYGTGAGATEAMTKTNLANGQNNAIGQVIDLKGGEAEVLF